MWAADLAMDPRLRGLRGRAGAQIVHPKATRDPSSAALTLTLRPHLRTAHRTKRPWQGAVEPPQLASLPEYDEKCYLCPGNERAGGKQTEKYEGTFVFEVGLRFPLFSVRHGRTTRERRHVDRWDDVCILLDDEETAADSVSRSLNRTTLPRSSLSKSLPQHPPRPTRPSRASSRRNPPAGNATSSASRRGTI